MHLEWDHPITRYFDLMGHEFTWRCLNRTDFPLPDVPRQSIIFVR
jgi:hypothetical protein